MIKICLKNGYKTAYVKINTLKIYPVGYVYRICMSTFYIRICISS